MTQHSFHECPLRSSSLIIIHQQKQTIVTATDTVFQYLGYSDPHQLIGKPIRLLNPRRFHNNTFLLECNDNSDKLFQLCMHHDPLTANSSHLEYWLLQPSATVKTIEDTCSLSVMRLSAFGTIEYAYLSPEFPQTMYELHGHPIMSYIHPSDVLALCEKLKQCRIYSSFPIRWLNKHPRYGNDDEHDFTWISFTVIHANTKASTGQYDPQTRPICILRPLLNHSSGSTILSHHLFDTFIDAVDQGKTYFMDYVNFIITLISQILEVVSNNQFDVNLGLLSHIHVLKETIDGYIWSTKKTIR